MSIHRSDRETYDMRFLSSRAFVILPPSSRANTAPSGRRSLGSEVVLHISLH